MQTTLAIVSPAAAPVLLLATVMTVAAGTSVLTPVSDRSGEDADSDGVFETLYSETTTQLYADSNYFGVGERRAAIEFDLSTIPTNAVVQSATFSLRAANFTLHNAEHLSGYPADGSVELGDMTGGSLLGAFTVPVATAIGTLEVGTHVQALLQSSDTHAGFRVQSAGCGIYSSCGLGFHPSGTAQGPTLSIQYAVPPRITGVAPTNAVDLGVEFLSQSGQTYFLERCLSFGDWAVSRTNISGNGGRVSVTDAGGQLLNEVYYRVGVEQ